MRNAAFEGGRGKSFKTAAPLRSSATQSQRREHPLGASARSVLRGELDNVGLPTVLTILEMERRSGVLIVEPADGRRQLGRLWVRDGQVVRALIEASKESPRRGDVGNDRSGSPMRGVDAVCGMLAWEEGQFEVWQVADGGQAEGNDEIHQPITFLLMEAARRTDEARGGGRMESPVCATSDFAF